MIRAYMISMLPCLYIVITVISVFKRSSFCGFDIDKRDVKVHISVHLLLADRPQMLDPKCFPVDGISPSSNLVLVFGDVYAVNPLRGVHDPFTQIMVVL